MENSQLSKYTTSFGLAVVLASVANAVLVVIKEKSPAVQSAMQKLTGHHWVTHSVIVIGLFVLCGWFFAQPNSGQGIKLTANRLIRTLVLGVATGALIIFGFYLFGD
jgi:hypothetical protein